LFLRPVDASAATVHTGVWRRRHGDGVVAAAVFAELVAGSYDVLGDDGRPIERVEIHGGVLAELDHRLLIASC
jgi:hypothetical protein